MALFHEQICGTQEGFKADLEFARASMVPGVRFGTEFMGFAVELHGPEHFERIDHFFHKSVPAVLRAH